MKNKFIFLVALCALVVTSAVFYRDRIAQAVGCNRYTSSSTLVPAGYGAWYDVFSPSVLLLDVDCGSATTFTVGKGSSSQIVSEKGWKWRASLTRWEEIIFTGATRYKDTNGNPLSWFVGSASSVIPPSVIDVGTNYVVGYVCTNRAGVWKCGCSDTACTERKWQLQAFTAAGPEPPSCNDAVKPDGCDCTSNTQCRSGLCPTPGNSPDLDPDFLNKCAVAGSAQLCRVVSPLASSLCQVGSSCKLCQSGDPACVPIMPRCGAVHCRTNSLAQPCPGSCPGMGCKCATNADCGIDAPFCVENGCSPGR